MLITSLSNNKIKYIKALNSDKKFREKEGVFVVEGMNSISELPPEMVRGIYVKETLYKKFSQNITPLNSSNNCLEMVLISDRVFDKISESTTPQGILALCERPSQKKMGKRDVVLLEKIRDPGNLGTIFRTAIALGLVDVLLIDCVDAFSPKVIRASLGAVLKANVLTFSSADEAVSFLTQEGVDILSLSMEGKSIYSFNNLGRVAIAVGGEAHGISNTLKEVSKEILKIPMIGDMESLNAAVSFSIAASYIENVKENNNFFSLFK